VENQNGTVGDANEANNTGTTSWQSLITDISASLRYAWCDTIIRNLLLLVAALSLALQGPLIVGGGLLASEHFGGAASFGILLSGWGFGGLAGAVVAGSVNTVKQPGRLLIVIGIIFGVSMSTVGFATHLLVATAIMGLMGWCEGFAEVHIFTWLQTYGDTRIQGRLMSLVTFASVGLEPVSYGFAGLLGEFDVIVIFLSAATLIFIATGIAASSREFRSIGG
jgi:hypothetical protein